MLYGLVLVIHALVAFFLIGVILLQGGRGGLGEALGGSGAQSLFGGGANIVTTKITAVASSLFMVTCLSLAALSTAKGRSVIERLPASIDQLPLALPPPEEALPTAPAESQPAQPGASATPSPSPSQTAP
jgi:preprotein translocase subunit SecG